MNARSGASAVGLTRLVSDRVDAVYADQGQLTIELRNGGSVKYSDVKAVS